MTATVEAPAPPALTHAQLLGKTAPEKDHLIVLNGAARTAFVEAEADLAEAVRRYDQERTLIAALHENRLTDPPPPDPKYLKLVVEAERAVEEARQRARGSAVVLRLRGLGKHEYDELMSKWPPTDEQVEKAEAEKRPTPAFDPEHFHPALIAECVANVEMTKEQAAELWQAPGWNERDLLDLFFACQDVCAIGGHVDLGNGSSSTRDSGPSSTTASRKASRTRST